MKLVRECPVPAVFIGVRKVRATNKRNKQGTPERAKFGIASGLL